MKRIALILLLVVPIAVARATPLRKGVSLPLWHDYISELDSSLDDLQADGADWVAVNVFWFQDTTTSTTIEPDPTKWTASDETVKTVIDAIHARGMQVLLKPMVDVRSGSWRGWIGQGKTGDNAWLDSWFDGTGGYGDFVNHWADIAEQKSVEIFSVGSELQTLAPLDSRWRNVVDGVEAAYSGSLTYGANHGGNNSPPEVTQAAVTWWDRLDFVGLNAYYQLTSDTIGGIPPATDTPTIAELREGWEHWASMIDTWHQAVAPDKPILFTELGYRSWDGTNKYPYSGTDKGATDVDQQEQADCYQALFEELVYHETEGKQDWLEGLFWWNWEVDPTWDNTHNPNWYPIQDKLAEIVLAQNYLVPEPATGLLLLPVLYGLRRRRRRHQGLQ